MKIYIEAYQNIHRMIPYFEKQFNIKIFKTLGDESMGVAYLTNKGEVLKITPSKNEVKISKKLFKKPHDHFPKIYDVKHLYDGWHGIYKEFIPPLDEKSKNIFKKLEQELRGWIEDDNKNILLYHILIKTKNDFFKEYLEDVHPNLLKIYDQLMNIVNYTIGMTENESVDIHIDNLGIKNNRYILYDY